MKAHVLFESNEHTNGEVVGVFGDRQKAEARFYIHVGELALDTLHDDNYEQSCTFSDEGWTYMPEDHSSVSVMLFFDVEVE